MILLMNNLDVQCLHWSCDDEDKDSQGRFLKTAAAAGQLWEVTAAAPSAPLLQPACPQLPVSSGK